MQWDVSECRSVGLVRCWASHARPSDGSRKFRAMSQAGAADDRAGDPVRSVWVSSDHGLASTRAVASEPQASRALWRLEGLKVPKRQPKRRRLWLNDGSCVRPGHRDHVWSYDFVLTRTHDGRAVRMLTILDEYTRECLAIDVARRLTSEDVLKH